MRIPKTLKMIALTAQKFISELSSPGNTELAFSGRGIQYALSVLRVTA